MNIHSASGIVRCSLSFLFNNKIIVVIGAVLATVPYFLRDWLYKSIMRNTASMDAFYSEAYLPNLILSISEYVLLSLFTILVTLYAYHRLKNEHVSIATVFKTAMKYIVAVIGILLVHYLAKLSLNTLFNKIVSLIPIHLAAELSKIFLNIPLLFFISLVIYTALLIIIVEKKGFFNGFIASLQSYGHNLRTTIALFCMYVLVRIIIAIPIMLWVTFFMWSDKMMKMSEFVLKGGLAYALVTSEFSQLLVAVMAAAFYANYDKLKIK